MVLTWTTHQSIVLLSPPYETLTAQPGSFRVILDTKRQPTDHPFVEAPN